MCGFAQALNIAETCKGRDGRKGTVGMRFPTVQELATILGIFTDGSVPMTVEQAQDGTDDTTTSSSCWNDITALVERPERQ